MAVKVEIAHFAAGRYGRVDNFLPSAVSMPSISASVGEVDGSEGDLHSPYVSDPFSVATIVRVCGDGEFRVGVHTETTEDVEDIAYTPSGTFYVPANTPTDLLVPKGAHLLVGHHPAFE